MTLESRTCVQCGMDGWDDAGEFDVWCCPACHRHHNGAILRCECGTPWMGRDVPGFVDPMFIEEPPF